MKTKDNLVASDSVLLYYHSKNFRTASSEINSSHQHTYTHTHTHTHIHWQHL